MEWCSIKHKEENQWLQFIVEKKGNLGFTLSHKEREALVMSEDEANGLIEAYPDKDFIVIEAPPETYGGA